MVLMSAESAATVSDGLVSLLSLSGAHPDTPLDGPPDVKTGEGEGEQAKKRRGRKKSKLEDMFPAYLQVLTVFHFLKRII